MSAATFNSSKGTMEHGLGDFYEDGTTMHTDDSARSLGKRIAEARETAGLSQEELAAQLGIKTSTVRKWESGSRAPRANRLQTIAGLVGTSLSWLLIGHGVAPTDRSLSNEEVAAELADLAVLAREMQRRVESLQSRMASQDAVR